ncbi:MAG: hypothetical protein RR313_07040 [Anaerovoracaceae bacterium]
MERIIVSILEICLVAGIYLLFFSGKNGNRIRGSFLGVSRGITEIALGRVGCSIKGGKNQKGFFRKQIIAIRKSKYEKEVWSSCLTLKNLALVQKEIPMSSDFILEQLMENSIVIKPVYAKILTSYRGGATAEAFEIFYDEIPTRSAKLFGAILLKLDQINPAELVEQMVAFQEAMASERVTQGMKKAEKNSIIITMFATATIFALLLNFAIVVVFMDTMSMLGQVF